MKKNIIIEKGALSVFILSTWVFLITGCAGTPTKIKSSVIDYLYSEGMPAIQPSIPVLNLPLNVGIAFVPETYSKSGRRNKWIGPNAAGGGALTEVNKTNLLERVADHFRKLEFVSDIEVIPSDYLTAGGGFKNLEQIKTIYGIDVIALVSYDQVQFTDEGLFSLSYLTIVGAFLISGERNDTSTMLDTVVYDIKSQKMLFRAPGTSNVKGKSTPINLSEELRADSLKGFELAADHMIKNLGVQLGKFKEKIKRNPAKVKIIHQSSYSGGGATGLLELAIALPLILVRLKKYINKMN